MYVCVHISFATLLHHRRAPCLTIYSFYSSYVVPSNKMTERGQRFSICFFTMLFLSKWKKFNLETSFFTARYTLVSYVCGGGGGGPGYIKSHHNTDGVDALWSIE